VTNSQDLILRRIQVERRKGTSPADLYQIISAMIRNQKIADTRDNVEVKIETIYNKNA